MIEKCCGLVFNECRDCPYSEISFKLPLLFESKEIFPIGYCKENKELIYSNTKILENCPLDNFVDEIREE